MKASGTGGGARTEGSLKEGGSLVGGAPGGLTCLWDGCADPFCTIPGFSCGKFWVLPCNHSDSLAVFQERRLLPYRLQNICCLSLITRRMAVWSGSFPGVGGGDGAPRSLFLTLVSSLYDLSFLCKPKSGGGGMWGGSYFGRKNLKLI